MYLQSERVSLMYLQIERERESEREREGESERARENVKNHQCKQPSFPQNAILKINYRLGSTDPLKKKTDKK